MLETESHVDSCVVDVMRSILPQELHGEIPVGFNTAGHIGSCHATVMASQADFVFLHLTLGNSALEHEKPVLPIQVHHRPGHPG
jgi:tRNA (guanine37-N1)-methyltransferase